MEVLLKKLASIFTTSIITKIDISINVLMWDNLKAHITEDSIETYYMAGHTVLARPQHSPHFSWQEGVFSNIRNYLEEHYEELTEQNFDLFIVEAINQVTPDKICGYAIGAHYYILGKQWQPWQGD